MSEDRIVYLPDLHVPFNIPLGPVFEFIEDFKPTIVILGGDAHDWPSVCHWIADQSRVLEGGTIARNYEELKNVVLMPLTYVTQRAKKIYLKGNHERWLDLAIELNPNGKGFWELEHNLPKEYQILGENVPFGAGPHLYYIHGIYVNKHHAASTVAAYDKSVIYGHTHDVQSFMHISPVDIKQFKTAQSAGCLCTMNPHYMRNKPNKWVNGFNFAYVDKQTGFFSFVQVYIVDNKFWANGRKYK